MKFFKINLQLSLFLSLFSGLGFSFSQELSPEDAALLLPEKQPEAPLINSDTPLIEEPDDEEVFIDELFLTKPLELPRDILSGYDKNSPLTHLSQEWRDRFSEMFKVQQRLRQMQRHSDAIFVLRQLLRLSPDHLPTKLDLGSSYVALQFYDLAKKEYEAAIELRPNFFAPQFNYSEMHFVIAFGLTKTDPFAEVIDPQIKEKQDQYLRLAIENFHLALEKIENENAINERRERKTSQERIEYAKNKSINQTAADLSKLKIFLCHLWLGEKTEATQIMLEYDAYSSSPNWYLMEAAIEYRQENIDQARAIIRRVRAIYPPAEFDKFIDSFVGIGWF